MELANPLRSKLHCISVYGTHREVVSSMFAGIRMCCRHSALLSLLLVYIKEKEETT